MDPYRIGQNAAIIMYNNPDYSLANLLAAAIVEFTIGIDDYSRGFVDATLDLTELSLST